MTHIYIYIYILYVCHNSRLKVNCQNKGSINNGLLHNDWHNVFCFCQIDLLGADHPYTHLVPVLRDVDPDDAFSSVPYEKGCALLMYLEQQLGGPGKNTLYIIYCQGITPPSEYSARNIH